MSSVDVIILSWDRIDDTIAAIQSALDQTGIELSIIIVDQGSKPEALLRLQEFCALDPRILVLCNSINNGVPGGRNQASFAGSGQYIVALDNDAVFADNEQLSRAVSILEEDPAIGALAFRIKTYIGDKDDQSSWSYNEAMADWADKRFKTVRFVGAGHAIRRDVFEKIGGYDGRLFFLHEEVDLATRIINAGYNIYYDPSVVIRHKVSAEHRVSWSGKRYYFDVRNKTYLHIKHKTRLATFILHTALLLRKGSKSGFAFPAFKGFGAALLMLPQALKERWSNPFVTQNAAAKAYMESCSPTKGWSTWQKIKFRIQQSDKKVGS